MQPHSIVRQELELMPATPGLDGEPGWLLYDPVRCSYFRLGPLQLELLQLIQRQTPADSLEPEQLHSQLEPRLASALSSEEIVDFLRFLRQNALLRCWTKDQREQLEQQALRLNPGRWRQLLRSYLFIRLPLFNPQSLLDALVPRLGWLLQRRSFWLLALLTLIGGFLSLRQLDSFQHALIDLVSPTGAATFALALLVTKLLHELGHAVAAHHFGCRVPSIGVALMVFWPVLYTDTTDAWRLTSRRQRVWIGASGILVELWIGALCLLGWNLLPDGVLRSVCFVLATSSWVMSLLINLNPLMRFDGYFVLSDLSGVENLQPRAFALGQWWLRRYLFGLPLTPPERPRRWLILFAWSCWLYRFFLLLGIALIIYQLFFKVLGIVLITLHLYRSLVSPVTKECKYLWSQRAQLGRRSLATIATVLLISGYWLGTPGQTTLVIPAQLEAAQAQPLYAESSGQLASLTADGPVNVGQSLYRFDTPDLSFQLQQVHHEEQALRWQLSHQSLASKQLRPPHQLQQELASVIQKQRALQRQIDQLQLDAPFSGLLRNSPPDLQPGDWVSRGMALGIVVASGPARVTGWADSSQRETLHEGMNGHFYSDGGSRTEAIPVSLKTISTTRSQQLESPLQADLYGGEIATLPRADGPIQPQRTLYPLHFTSDQHAPERILRGIVHLESETPAPLWQLWRRILGVWRREAGF